MGRILPGRRGRGGGVRARETDAVRDKVKQSHLFSPIKLGRVSILFIFH